MNKKNSLNLHKIDELPNTVEGCHDLIRNLLQTITELFKRVEKLEVENRELKERLNNNSSNSSLPPSKDFKKNKNKKPPSNNKGGSQKGHKGSFRELLKLDEVSTIINCELPTHCLCGGNIKLKNEHQRHQVHELPEIKLHVTEYCLEKGYCADCGQNQTANLPEGITWGITGPKLTALMSHLVAKYGLSRRELKEFLKEQFQFNISLGTVFNKQKIVNTSLEAPVSELLEAIKQSPSINADETGHNRDGKRQWMWVFVSSTYAFFSIKSSRGKKILKFFIGDFKNIVISDRYASYNHFDSSCRQICWAHLKRDFTRLSEKANKIIRRIGKNLLIAQAKLFEAWHEFKQNQITRDELLRRSQPIRKHIGELLEQGSYTDPTLKAVGFCKNLLTNFDALWTFLSTEHVEPTNNHAERCLRHSVIWRKKYFCTRSDYGSEFVARSASINTTCKLQAKNAFQFLNQAVQSHFSKKAAPSLLVMA
jgi:transposase